MPGTGLRVRLVRSGQNELIRPTVVHVAERCDYSQSPLDTSPAEHTVRNISQG